MSTIITEEYRVRQRAVEYAIKENNNAKAARRYHTSRQQIARWRKRYDGTVQSLLPKSRRPHYHPKAHTEEEIELIRNVYQRYKRDGLAEVYVQCQKRGYQRHYGSLIKIIKTKIKIKEVVKKRKYPRSKWCPEKVHYPGEKVQIDIKYVPQTCIGWNSYGKRYYQITAIDEYTRKRVCEIVDEKSMTNTAKFLLKLEEKMGFKIKKVQTDNGKEFVNDKEQEQRESLFEQVLRNRGIKYQRTRPYSPWQNGKVERSHREDGTKFYNKVFKSLEELKRKHQRYVRRGNNVARKILGFKSANEILSAYMMSVS